MIYSTAYHDGWLAHSNGVDCDQNPYDERRQMRSHNEWNSGWFGRFGHIKNGRDLPEELERNF